MTANDPTSPRRATSLQRRLLLFAAVVLAPVLVGALASGLILLQAATRSQGLAEEIVNESAVSVTLFESLEAARRSGSQYMEEGEADDLKGFQSARRDIERLLALPAFDEDDERSRIDAVEREWRAAVRQLAGTPTGLSSSIDDAEDPEDVFEHRVNAAIGASRSSSRSPGARSATTSSPTAA